MYVCTESVVFDSTYPTDLRDTGHLFYSIILDLDVRLVLSK